MTKKEFLKELKKRFDEIGCITSDSVRSIKDKYQDDYTWTLDFKDNLSAKSVFHFFVESENANDKTFTPPVGMTITLELTNIKQVGEKE